MATARRPRHDATSEIAIFGRLIKPDKTDLSRELAQYILTLGFGKKDQNRMSALAQRNQDGSLSSDDKAELDHFVKAGHLLALLHSKARRTLNSRKVS